jgi:nicotinamide riboside kinase
MKIAITGAHGTGKTTLAHRIANRFGLAELPTPGRTMAQQSLPVNLDATVTSQALAWFIQAELEAATTDWVANRSLLDVWAYAAVAAERAAPTDIETALLDQMEATTRAMWPGRYDAVFYTPPRIPLVADDVRSADPGFQAAVDGRIRRALSDWRLAHITVDVTSDGDLEAAERLLASLVTPD